MASSTRQKLDIGISRQVQWGLLLFLGGCALLQYRVIPSFDEGFRSEHWPKLQGSVENARILESVEISGSHFYISQVTYSYRALGLHRTAERLFFGSKPGPNFPTLVDHVAANYAKGMAVQISVDPANTSHSTLEPGITARILAMAGVAALFMMIGLQQWRTAYRIRAHARRAIRLPPVENPGGINPLAGADLNLAPMNLWYVYQPDCPQKKMGPFSADELQKFVTEQVLTLDEICVSADDHREYSLDAILKNEKTVA